MSTLWFRVVAASPSLFLLLVLVFFAKLSAGVKRYNFNFEIRENAPVRSQVGDLKRSPTGQRILPSDLVNANTYSTKELCINRFVVNKKTAVVLVRSPIDREEICPDLKSYPGSRLKPTDACICYLQIIVRGIIADVKVTILDENDHAPEFMTDQKFITIRESAPVGFEHSLEPASDPDLPPNTIKRYTLARNGDSSVDISQFFAVSYEANSAELMLRLLRKIDYETVSVFNLTLDACDGGRPERCVSQPLYVNVFDENDNSPEFKSNRINVKVNENATEGYIVVSAKAVDRDSGENARLTYRKKSNRRIGARTDGTSFFGVNEENGDIYVQRALRFESGRDRVSLQIEASDHGSPVRRAVMTVNIQIVDINDHSPKIQVRAQGGASRVELMEDGPRESTVAHLFVTDADDPKSAGGRFRCNLDNSGVSSRPGEFRLELVSSDATSRTIYRLNAMTVFDREERDEAVVHVVCQDEGGLSSSRDIRVHIIDRNEFKPSFDGTPYIANVTENGNPEQMVLRVRASDQDRTAVLRYSLDREGRQYFRIVPETGQILTLRPLNREEMTMLSFGVQVTDSVDDSSTRHVGRANVTVYVVDVNDNPPMITEPLRFSIEENTPDQNTLGARVAIGRLQAIDPDDSLNGEVTWQLVKVKVSQVRRQMDEVPPPLPRPPPNGTFHIRNDGTLFLTRPLDREVHEQLLLEVRASDRGRPPLASTSTVTVVVRDTNDNPPAWRHPTTHENTKNISSLARAGYLVTRVRAVDPDLDSTVTYSLVDGSRYFSVHEKDGEVRLREALRPDVYRLKFRASDAGSPKQSSEIEYFVRIFYQAPLTAGTGTLGYSGMNLPLIVAMIAVTCIICVSLVIAIVVVRRKSNAGRHQPSPIDFGDGGASESTQKWVQEGVNGNGSQAGNLYTPGHHWMRPEIYSTAANTSPAVSASCYHGNSVDKYHHAAPVNHTGQQSQAIRMHGLPVDMEVASADSGHGASEEEGLQSADQRNKELRLQRTPCPILPEDSVVQCGCSTAAATAAAAAAAATAAPTTTIAGHNPFHHSLYDYSRTLDFRGTSAMPMVGLNSNTLGPMSSFRNYPIATTLRQPSLAASVGGAAGLPERRPSQSNV